MPSVCRDAGRSRRWSPTTPRPRPPRWTKATDSWRDIGSLAAKIATALDDVPVIGTEEAGYRLGPAVRDRHARLAAALASTRGVEASWLQLASGSAAATRLSNLLADHDEAVIAAAEQGRDAEYDAALTILDDADTAIADARRLRNALARTVEVVTLDEWLDRNARYDVALRDLYTALTTAAGASPTPSARR